MLKGIKKKRLQFVEEKQVFLFNETGLNFMHEEQEKSVLADMFNSTCGIHLI